MSWFDLRESLEAVKSEAKLAKYEIPEDYNISTMSAREVDDLLSRGWCMNSQLLHESDMVEPQAPSSRSPRIS